MTAPSPLMEEHARTDPILRPWGPAPEDGRRVEIVAAFDRVEIEYAALRKSAGVIDLPERGVLEVRGRDRLDFLNRMITQEVKGLGELRCTRSFWLNRKGRIDADLRVIELGDRTLLEMDIHATARTKAGLEQFVFSEEVEFADRTAELHRIAVHGPRAAEVVGRAAVGVARGRSIGELRHDDACEAEIAGVRVVIDRQDSIGEPGLWITAPAARAKEVFDALADRAVIDQDRTEGAAVRSAERAENGADANASRARPVGWFAYNSARVEAGWAMYNIDFGVTSLPHETGRETLMDRVSFTKGCYLGQEVVARMESLGHPKQRLVGLRMDGHAGGEVRTPTDGAAVFAEGPDGATVGAVTSATVSPMLGAAGVAFAMMKWAASEEGTRVVVEAEGSRVGATVQHRLRFWERK